MKSSVPTNLDTISPAAAVIDGLIYLVRGPVTPVQLLTNYVYNPASDTWSAKAPMPTPRYLLGAATVNEILYAVGGSPPPGVQIATAANEAYDPTTDSWTMVAPLPMSRTPGVGVANGLLYAIGGYDYNDGTLLSTNEVFTPTVPGVASLTGGNSFTGNQTVSGNVSATSFSGDGSTLLNINPSNIAAGIAD